jgi:hypothetical protein
MTHHLLLYVFDPAASPLAGMTRQAIIELRGLVTDVQTPLLSWFLYASQIAAAVIIAIAIFQMAQDEQTPGPDRIVRQGVRSVFWIGLTFALSGLLSYAAGIGTAFAHGSMNGSGAWSDSVLNSYRKSAQKEFTERYESATRRAFLVKVTPGGTFHGVPIFVPGGPDKGSGEFIGAPTGDRVAGIDHVKDRFNPNQWTPGQVFAALNFARLVLEFADLFLIILIPLVMIALKLAAPWMAVMGIHRGFAQKMTYPFFWSAAVITLALPTVMQVVRIFVYKAGILSLKAFPDGDIFTFSRNGTIVRADNDPMYGAAVCGLVMLVGALCMFATPFLAYRLASGQIFEALSSTAFGWMGSLTSFGVSAYTAAASAQVSAETEVATATGGATSVQVQGMNAKTNLDTSEKAAQIEAARLRAEDSVKANIAAQVPRLVDEMFRLRY